VHRDDGQGFDGGEPLLDLIPIGAVPGEDVADLDEGAAIGDHVDQAGDLAGKHVPLALQLDPAAAFLGGTLGELTMPLADIDCH